MKLISAIEFMFYILAVIYVFGAIYSIQSIDNKSHNTMFGLGIAVGLFINPIAKLTYIYFCEGLRLLANARP